MIHESWSWLLVVTPRWHMACHIIKNWVISHKSKWYYLIHKFKSFKYIYIYINYPKIEHVVILLIIAKPWCHVTFWCPLQLHSNFCDYVVINIVEKYNSRF